MALSGSVTATTVYDICLYFFFYLLKIYDILINIYIMSLCFIFVSSTLFPAIEGKPEVHFVSLKCGNGHAWLVRYTHYQDCLNMAG